MIVMEGAKGKQNCTSLRSAKEAMGRSTPLLQHLENSGHKTKLVAINLTQAGQQIKIYCQSRDKIIDNLLQVRINDRDNHRMADSDFRFAHFIEKVPPLL